MTDIAYPTVYAALVATADAALTLRVVDGYDISDDPGDLMVLGVPDITDETAISAGSFTQSTATFGVGVREENGTINGFVLASNGNGDSAAARAAAFGYLNSLGAALRTAPVMGIATFDVNAQVSSGDVLEDKVDGATTVVSFTVAYKALI